MKDRPSATAVFVARGIAAVAAEPALAALVPLEAVRLTRAILRRESLGSRAMLAALGWSPSRRLVFAVADRITPGLFLHLALRKRFVEARVRAALDEGFAQVVVLGAGLDTLAPRLAPEFPEVRFLEIDHPASQGAKRRLLPAGVEGATNLRFAPLDLALPGARVEDSPDFLPDLPTVFIAEGLLMYLPVDAVRTLFAALAAGPGRRRVVLSAMTVQPGGRIGFRMSSGLVDRWLALRHEPFLWGIRPDEISGFLEPLGFVLRDHADADRLRGENPSVGDRPVAEGEHLYVAEAEGG